MTLFVAACLAASLVANITLALLVTSLTDRLRHPGTRRREAKAVTPHVVDVRRPHPRVPSPPEPATRLDLLRDNWTPRRPG